MAQISNRTMARAEAWIEKTNIKKLRKLLLDKWVLPHSQKEIDKLSDEEIRETMKEELRNEDISYVEEALENVGIEVVHSDDDGDGDGGDFDEEE